jgi:biotin carboxyl carrier protein
MKKTLFIVALLALASAGVYFWTGGKEKAGAAGQDAARDRPIAVKTVTAKVQPMPIIVEAVGSVEPEHSVAVRAQVNGVLEQVLFREGDKVQRGQLLFRIDDRALRAVLDQARAALARDQAQLREAEAQRERLKPLAEREYITRQEYAQAVASAEALAATVGVDRAQVKAARVQLGYSEIRTPITGRTGSLAVKAGNLVSAAATTPLVVINSIQPVRVAFNIPQAYLQEVRRNLSSTLITALILPTSVLGTFTVMYLLGYSLNNLSLMALTLAVGFVVDDAIVVLENISRHIEMGKDRLTATLDGTREIGFTIVSMTVSLAAVFIPILFMAGILGRLFKEFAVTVGVAVLVSGIISLSLTPMVCSLFLQPTRKHGRFYRRLENLFERARGLYGRSLGSAMRHRGLMLLASAAILELSGWLFAVVPKGFIPGQDTGLIVGNTCAPEGIPFPELVKRQLAVAEVVRTNPNVESLMSTAGQGTGGVTGGNVGRLTIRLKPAGERDASADEVIQELRGATRGIEGIRLILQNPEIRVHILRDRAASLGVSPEQIETALNSAFGGREISTIYGVSDQYRVFVQLAEPFQRDINALNALYLQGANARLVPLTSVAEIKSGVGPISIEHYGQLPSITLSFNLAPGTSIGAAVSAIQALVRESLPRGVSTTLTGSAKTFEESMCDLPILLAITIGVIYMILATGPGARRASPWESRWWVGCCSRSSLRFTSPRPFT